MERIGRYRIESRLGGGGMGVVYRAVRDGTEERVALKTVYPGRPGLAASLGAEIAALSRLRHPGVVRVVDHGVDEGRPWFAMDLLEGETLETAARTLVFGRSSPLSTPVSEQPTRRRPPRGRDAVDEPHQDRPPPAPPPRLIFDAEHMRRIARVAMRLARALAYVHGEGIVHRDLKPDNIVILPGERPVLVDFGIARALTASLREELAVDREIVGTVAYVAPEQVLGDAPDPRSDLYSLGCVLYRLLTERPPFVASNAAAVMRAHVYDAPAPPSDHVEGLPAALDDVVLALLEKDPVARLSYADDVVTALASAGFEVPDDVAQASSRSYVYAPCCAGRNDELAAVSAMVDRARAEEAGAGFVVTVAGESGVGKTRFMSEMIRALPREVTVVAATAEAPADAARSPRGRGGSVPRCALAPLLSWVEARARDNEADRARGWMGPHAHLLALLEPALMTLVDFGSMPPLPKPDRIAEATSGALVDLALEIARDVPLALVLDDAQWADDVSLQFFEKLAAREELATVPLFAFAAYRSEEATFGWLAQGLQGSRVGSIDLAPLPAVAMGRAAVAMLGMPPDATGDATVATIVERAQNSPFALVELVRLAVETGVLARSAGAWTLGAGADEFWRASGKVADRVARLRLEQLAPEALAVATAVALAGRRVPADLVGAMAFERPPAWAESSQAAALDVLGELFRLHVVVEPAPGQVAVAHDKLREAASALLDPTSLAATHARIARALETVVPLGAETLVDVATHDEHARDFARAAAGYLRASDAFEERGAVMPLLECLRAAVRVAAHLETKHIERRLASARLGGVLTSLGRIDEASPLLDDAREQAIAQEDDRTLAAVLVHLAYAAYLRGDGAALLDRANAAVRLATAVGDDKLLGRAENALGIAYGSSGHFRRAIGHYARAAELAGASADVASVGKHMSNISINYRLLGELDAALDAAKKAVQATARSATSHANAWSNLGRIYLERGELELAEAALGRAVEIAARFEYAVVLVEARWGLAEIELARGDTAGAQARATAVLAMAEERGFAVARAQAMRTIALARLRGGADPVEAIGQLEASVTILEETQERDELADGLMALAGALDLAGNSSAAASRRRAAVSLYRELDMAGRLRSAGVMA